MTFRTFVFDGVTLASTGGAGLLRLHASEHRVDRAHCVTLAATGRTGLCLTIFRAASVTMVASDVFLHLELLGYARGHLVQRQTYL